MSFLRFWKPPRFREHQALTKVSLEIRRGERIAILGRNGAGKTTLLKLITGNFAPTSGDIWVNGKVQALMSVGLGFHPEFTGYENIIASLAYNDLKREDLDRVVQEVIEFVELGNKAESQFRNVPDYEGGLVSKKVLRVVLSYVDYVNRAVWSK